MKERKNWYHLIDGIRGIAIVNMILFHFMYDVTIVFGRNPNWYQLKAVRFWQQCICFSFILISGVSCHFSKNNFKRGLLLNVYGLLITLVTAVFLPSEIVWFGILNFIGCAVILLHLLRPGMQRIPAGIGFVCAILLFLFFRDIQSGYLGFFGVPLVNIPGILYTFPVLTPLGLPFPGFYSSDYFPLLPWFFLFSAGYYAWTILSNYEKIKKLFCKKIPLFSFIGTKSIWIYLIHQPAAMLIAYLFFR